MKKSPAQKNPGFTLIELLVVISIIAILAALMIPAMGKIRQNMAIKRAQAELNRVQTAIESYHAKRGHYPPDRFVVNLGYSRSALYYELVGCYATNSGLNFLPRDGSPIVAAAALGTGVQNSSTGSGDDAAAVDSFLKELKPNQYGPATGVPRYLGVTVDGPGAYMIGDLNPFQYNSSNPTNNPGRFDLWVDVVFAKKTNRVCNWRATRIINP